jgi:hypothetical protein
VGQVKRAIEWVSRFYDALKVEAQAIVLESLREGLHCGTLTEGQLPQVIRDLLAGQSGVNRAS